MAGDERQLILQQQREVYYCEEIIGPRSAVPSFDYPTVIVKIAKIYEDLFSLQSIKCFVCQEQFPFITVNADNVCTRSVVEEDAPVRSG